VPPVTLGEIAYNAYRDAVGGISRFTNTVLPDFEDQEQEIRAAWESAAFAVRHHPGDAWEPVTPEMIRANPSLGVPVDLGGNS
jgi:hypothetical protein